MINVNDQKPEPLINVLVCYTLHNQDFWTRGYRNGDRWSIMLWSGSIDVSLDEIIYWMPLPKRN